MLEHNRSPHRGSYNSLKTGVAAALGTAAIAIALFNPFAAKEAYAIGLNPTGDGPSFPPSPPATEEAAPKIEANFNPIVSGFNGLTRLRDAVDDITGPTEPLRIPGLPVIGQDNDAVGGKTGKVLDALGNGLFVAEAVSGVGLGLRVVHGLVSGVVSDVVNGDGAANKAGRVVKRVAMTPVNAILFPFRAIKKLAGGNKKASPSSEENNEPEPTPSTPTHKPLRAAPMTFEN